METIFIYSKGNKIKCLNIVESKALHSEMLDKGWVHAHTLNPCVFIEYLFGKTDKEIVKAIRGLKINK